MNITNKQQFATDCMKSGMWSKILASYTPAVRKFVKNKNDLAAIISMLSVLDSSNRSSTRFLQELVVGDIGRSNEARFVSLIMLSLLRSDFCSTNFGFIAYERAFPEQKTSALIPASARITLQQMDNGLRPSELPRITEFAFNPLLLQRSFGFREIGKWARCSGCVAVLSEQWGGTQKDELPRDTLIKGNHWLLVTSDIEEGMWKSTAATIHAFNAMNKCYTIIKQQLVAPTDDVNASP